MRILNCVRRICRARDDCSDYRKRAKCHTRSTLHHTNLRELDRLIMERTQPVEFAESNSQCLNHLSRTRPSTSPQNTCDPQSSAAAQSRALSQAWCERAPHKIALRTRSLRYRRFSKG